MKKSVVALLSSALVLQAAGAVQLLPFGEFAGRDGRPGNGLSWKINDAQGRELAQRMTARHQRVEFQFDYEHQAILSEENGQPAPASGWGSTFEWRDGVGLFATDVRWTARAKQMIEADEYRYISPVIAFDKKTGVVTDVLNAALVGIPNLDLLPVAHQRVARMNAGLSDPSTLEPSPMNETLKALLLALGLPEATEEKTALSAVAALKAKADSVDGLTTEIAALKAKTPDPSKWVSVDQVAALTTEVAALKSAQVNRDVEDVLGKARAEGKLIPAVEQIWRDIGKADLAKLKAMVEATPANPALAGRQQTTEVDPSKKGEAAELSADEIAVCRNLGITAEQFRKGAAATA